MEERIFYLFPFVGEKHSIQLRSAWLFTSELNYGRMLVFYEDGKYYEYFTNRDLGVIEKQYNQYRKTLCIPNTFYEVTHTYNSGLRLPYIEKITATYFAEEVKKFMPYESQIARAVNSYLQKLSSEYEETKIIEEIAIGQKAAYDTENQNWLFKQLDSKKNRR